MAPGSGPLLSLLAHARRRLRRAVLTEGALVGVTGLLAAIVLGSLMSWAGASAATIALAELALAGVIVLYAAIRYGAVLSRSLRANEAVARWLDRASAARTSSTQVTFTSAIELDRDRGRFPESPALIERAVELAADRARRVDVDRLVAAEAHPRWKRAGIVAGGVAVALALLAITVPQHVKTALGAASALSTLEAPLSRLAPEPRLSDFQITYRFPAYARRPQRTISTPSGDIRALPGTEVTIESQSRHELIEATLLTTSGSGADGEVTRTAANVEGRRLKVTTILSRAGTYRFRVKTTDGDLLEERRGHKIELELDAPPEVSLRRPETSPLEVNEGDRVDLAFSAEDDFGLGDVQVAWRVLGSAREGKQLLTTSGRGERRLRTNGQFDLSALGLKPGDRIAYSVEALDNDTVNGPKVGASETKELRIYSKDAHHREVLALQEKALDELVHVLGDNLENVFRAESESERYDALLKVSERIVERARATSKLLNETVAAIRKDPLGLAAVASAFDSANKDLLRGAERKSRALAEARGAFARKKKADEARSGAVKRQQDRMVTDLERNVVYLADLLNDQRMLDAEALTKQLREEQQALRKALEDYKNAPDAKKREMLAQAIKDIKQRISEITTELAKLKGSIPQDFVNPDALETQDTLAGMDRVQKMIEEGDLDAAMAELERMLNQTENMLSQMQNGREELGSREYGETYEMAKKLWKDLEQLEADQRSLARKTEQHSKEMLERMKSRLGKPDAFVEKQMKRLEEIGSALERAEPGAHLTEGDTYDQAIRRIDDVGRALQAQDFGAAREMAERALSLLGQLENEMKRRAEQARRFGDFLGHGPATEASEKEIKKARPLMGEVLKDIERLMPSPDEILSPEERQELKQLADREQELKNRAQGVGEQLNKLNEELPIVGEGMQEAVSEAKDAMEQAGGGLGEGDAPGALNQQRRALEALGRLRDSLEQMAKNQGQGGGGGGVPLPFGSPDGTGSEDRSGEGRDINPQDKVEIPKPDQYKAPQEFREDILEAAKQGTVEAYRDAVRRYYEEIVK